MSNCTGCAPNIRNPLKPFEYTHMPKGEVRKVSKRFYECACIMLWTLSDDDSRKYQLGRLLTLRDDVLLRIC